MRWLSKCAPQIRYINIIYIRGFFKCSAWFFLKFFFKSSIVLFHSILNSVGLSQNLHQVDYKSTDNYKSQTVSSGRILSVSVCL